MERNAENTRRIVGQLMASGMVGQARAGDTIGFWTFSEELKTGDFPLQRWTPQTRDRLASAAVEFLGRHPYEKRSRFEKVAAPLTSVVKDSDRITVLIITDGSEKISGTPFDQEINESYRLNQAAQRKQRMPFITVLRAKDGEYIGWRVNAPPFRPEFPAFPAEPKSEEPPDGITGSKPDSKPGRQTTPVPSLVVIGEKPAPALSTSTNVPTVETTQPLVAQTPVTPNALPQPQPETQPSIPVETRKTTAPTEFAAVAKPVEPTKPEVQPTTPPPAVTSTPSEIEPSPATPAPEPDVPTQTVQTALATPTESLFNRTNLLIAGAVLLVVAFGLFYALMRRAVRPAGKVSLITSSMDHDEKQ